MYVFLLVPGMNNTYGFSFQVYLILKASGYRAPSATTNSAGPATARPTAGSTARVIRPFTLIMCAAPIIFMPGITKKIVFTFNTEKGLLVFIRSYMCLSFFFFWLPLPYNMLIKS